MSAVVLDVSSLTVHARQFIRTGIQEVVYRTLLSATRLRHEFPDHRIVLLPRLPRQADGETIVPYFDAQPEALREIERQTGLSSAETWGFDLAAEGYRVSDERALQILGEADVVHFQGLVNVGPLFRRLKKPRLSLTVYDLVPVLYPEFCDDGIARWYSTEYLPAISRHVTHASCISRHTALDLRAHPLGARIPSVSVLPLPAELPRVQAEGRPDWGRYIVFLGSLEPRKNFEALLDGFETYVSEAQDPAKLVLVGGTGWKSAALERRLRRSPAAPWIVRAGYVEDRRLPGVLGGAAAVALLSYYEGYGLPLAQATSLGVPVITTAASSLPEACAGRGLFVDPTDRWSVAAAIRVALETPHGVPVGDGEGWMRYTRALLRSAIA